MFKDATNYVYNINHLQPSGNYMYHMMLTVRNSGIRKLCLRIVKLSH